MMIGVTRHGSIKTRTEGGYIPRANSSLLLLPVGSKFYCGCVVGKGIRSEENRYESPEQKTNR